jgi:hypothetical protein
MGFFLFQPFDPQSQLLTNMELVYLLNTVRRTTKTSRSASNPRVIGIRIPAYVFRLSGRAPSLSSEQQQATSSKGSIPEKKGWYLTRISIYVTFMCEMLCAGILVKENLSHGKCVVCVRMHCLCGTGKGIKP